MQIPRLFRALALGAMLVIPPPGCARLSLHGVATKRSVRAPDRGECAVAVTAGSVADAAWLAAFGIGAITMIFARVSVHDASLERRRGYYPHRSRYDDGDPLTPAAGLAPGVPGRGQ